MRFSPVRAAAAVAVAALTCGLVAAAPADAATHHPLTTAGLHAKLPKNAFRNAGQSSPSGAGYVAFLGAGNVSSAGATIKVPSFSCASDSDQEWLLPGIWGIDQQQQILSEEIALNLNCDGGTPSAEAVVFVGGTSAEPLPVSPGDLVELSLSEAPNQTAGAVHDLTQGTQASTTGAPAPGDDGVFVGDFGPSFFGVNAVPTFNKVKFSTVTINGGYLADSEPLRFNLATAPDDVQIKTSGITGGTAFTSYFKNNY